MKKFIYSLGLAVFAVFLVAGIVQAATTIGTAISTGSTLSVTGASTLTGALYGNGGLDRSTAAALAIGATNATSVVITPATTITGAATLSSTLGLTSDLTVDTNTLKVDATNNYVGVGTTTPKSNLSISTSAGTAPTVRLLEVASTTGTSLFKVLASGNTSVAGTLTVTGAATLSSTLGLTSNLTVDTNTLIVDATNNFVGIGTTTPKSNLSVSTNAATTPATRLFNVASTTGAALFTVLASGNTSVAGTLAVTGATTLTAGLTIDTNTLIVDATNNFVGVGTTTPKSNFSISTSAATTPATRLLEVASTTGTSLFKVLASGNTSVAGTLVVTGATTLSSTLGLTSNLTVDTNTLIVDATNNFVGVGTTTPKSILSVSTSASMAPTTRLLEVASTTGTSLFKVLANGQATFAATTTLNSGLIVDTDTLYVNPATNRVGIASSTPKALLSVGGNSASSTIDISKMCIQTSTTAGVRYHIYLKADGSLGTQVGNCP